MKCVKCGGALPVCTMTDLGDHVIRYRDCKKCGTRYRTAELIILDQEKNTQGKQREALIKIFEKYGYKVQE